MTPDPTLPGTCIGVWLLSRTGKRPCRVTGLRWTEDGGQCRVWTEIIKRDGSRGVITYSPWEWARRSLTMRVAHELEAALLDERAERWER